MEIRELTTRDEVVALSDVLLEYITFVSDEVRTHFGIDMEAAPLHAKTMGYIDTLIPPMGRAFVAGEGDQITGMIFLRPSDDDAVEIKRLYVRPEGRGRGLGARLIDHALAAARKMGAKHVVLDSTKNLRSAAKLYESRGFRYTGPYTGSDHSEDTALLPYMIFMRRDL